MQIAVVPLGLRVARRWLCGAGESSGWVGRRRLMREGCGAERALVARGREGGGDSDWDGRRRLMRDSCGAERALVARGGEGGAGAAIGPGGGG